MPQIANPDRTIMNRLFASEATRLGGGKTAAGKGIESDQAFKDHEEFLGTLETVLKSDDKTEFDPNDPIQD